MSKPIKTEAEQAAQLAVDLLNGETPSDTTDFQDVPSYILDPIAVMQDNVKDTVVKDEFYTVDQICTDQYADACASAGLS